MFKSSKSHRQQLKALALASLVAIADAPLAEAADWISAREGTCFDACARLKVQPYLLSIRMERLPLCRVYKGQRNGGYWTGYEINYGWGLSVSCVALEGSYKNPYQCLCGN
jgi:hypothetical protein